jgi:nitrate reductase gamma subunit
MTIRDFSSLDDYFCLAVLGILILPARREYIVTMTFSDMALYKYMKIEMKARKMTINGNHGSHVANEVAYD